jgi:branched-subunit amino acid transport protein
LNADYWWTILVLGGVVYTTRVIGLLALPSDGLPPSAERCLRLAPVAILTALVVPSLISLNGIGEPAVLIASAATVVVTAALRQPVLGLVAGVLMVVLARLVS